MKKNILVVDDDKDVLFTLKEELRFLGHNVTPINDSTTAANLSNISDFDIILLDIMMPKLNGFDLVKLFRPKSNGKIVILSGFSDIMSTDPIMSHVDLVVEKPYLLEDIKHILD
jgi:two-component system response regulator CpxR